MSESLNKLSMTLLLEFVIVFADHALYHSILFPYIIKLWSQSHYSSIVIAFHYSLFKVNLFLMSEVLTQLEKNTFLPLDLALFTYRYLTAYNVGIRDRNNRKQLSLDERKKFP